MFGIHEMPIGYPLVLSIETSCHAAEDFYIFIHHVPTTQTTVYDVYIVKYLQVLDLDQAFLSVS
jgi:hypothetical protein